MLRPLLAAGFALVAAPAWAELSDCDSPAFRAAVTAQPAWACVEIERRAVSAQGQAFAIRSVRDASTPAGLVSQHAARSLDAMETAYASLATLAAEFGWEFGDVTVVLADPDMVAFEPEATAVGTNLASANALSFPRECVVSVSIPAMDAAGLDTLDTALVHELVHCVQGWTYAPFAGDMAAHHWWIEATATHFQHMFVPDEANLAAWSQAFLTTIETTPLTRQPYSGQVFFAWAMQHHRDRLPGLLRDLAAAGGEAAQGQVLRDTFGSEGFQEFARALVDGTIVTPSGYAVPPVPGEPAATTVDGDQASVTLPLVPFTLLRHRLDMARGTYNVIAGLSGLDVRPVEGGPWFSTAGGAPLGLEDCADVLSLLAAQMPTNPMFSDIGITAIRVTACSGCSAPAQVDACVVGTWEVSNAAYGDMLQAMVDDGTHATVTGIEGQAILVLSDDGTGQWVLQGHRASLSVPLAALGGANAVVEMQADGIATGRWGVAEDAIHWCAGSTQGGFTSSVTLPGMGEVTEETEGPLEDSVWSYKCGPDRMKLIYFGPRAIQQDVRWELTRRD